MVREGYRPVHLAELVGVTYQTLRNWITDKHPPDRAERHSHRLLEVLHMTAEELWGIAEGQDPPFKAWREFVEIAGPKLSPDERRSLAGFPWPPGKQPTVESYWTALSALRQAVSRD